MAGAEATGVGRLQPASAKIRQPKAASSLVRGRGGIEVRSIGGIVGDDDFALAVIGDSGFAGDQVVRNDGAADAFPEIDLGFVLTELAAAYEDSATGGLE